MASANSVAKTSPSIRIGFPHIFVKKMNSEGTSSSYQLRLDFDKNNPEQMAFLKGIYNDLTQVLAAQWPDPATRPRIPLMGHDKSPIKDGDTAVNQSGIPMVEKYPELAGHYFVNCANYDDGPLVVVDRGRHAILDKSAVYSGCFCKVNINCYARTRRDNPGVSIGLNGVQKWDDGENLGGSAPAVADMFDADPNAVRSGAPNPDVFGGPQTNPFAGAGQDPQQQQAPQQQPDPFAGAEQPPQQQQAPFAGAGQQQQNPNPFGNGGGGGYNPGDVPF